MRTACIVLSANVLAHVEYNYSREWVVMLTVCVQADFLDLQLVEFPRCAVPFCVN